MSRGLQPNGEPGTVPERTRWLGLGLLVLIPCALVYGAVSGLTGEYGKGVVESTAIVPVALLVGLVVVSLVRQMYRAANATPPLRGMIAAGVVAALGVVIAAAVGALTGGAAHQQRQEAIDTSCDGGADTRTIAFAGEVGRIIPTNERSAIGVSDGCSVTVAIDKAQGDDPLAVIERAVAGGEWQRRGDAVWVADDGFQIEVRVDTSFAEDAEHAVYVVGTRP